MPPLPGAALWTARTVAHSFRARRNLLRSLALQVRKHPELADESLRARRVAQHSFLIEALVRAGARPAAAQTALFFAVSICLVSILFLWHPSCVLHAAVGCGAGGGGGTN